MKTFYVFAILFSLTACGSGSDTSNNEDTMRISTSGTSADPATVTDSTITTNQSGATGNGGVGTGTINGASESALDSSGSAPK